MVTATSDRRRDPQVGFNVAGWGERSAFGSARGWPWWAAVLLTKGVPTSSGTTSKLIALGVPLVTGFPTMAITTGATVLIGGIRFLVQRKPAGADADEDDARGG